MGVFAFASLVATGSAGRRWATAEPAMPHTTVARIRTANDKRLSGLIARVLHAFFGRLRIVPPPLVSTLGVTPSSWSSRSRAGVTRRAARRSRGCGFHGVTYFSGDTTADSRQ